MKRAGLVLLLLTAVLTIAQQPATKPPATPTSPVALTEPAADSTPGRYVGVASCANAGCHGSTQPLNTTSVLQNEYYTWLNNDRHAGAYNVLFNERSARIAKNMRLKKRAYEEAVCLDCHTTNIPAQLVSGAVDLEDGVQCEVCHGPASGWRNEHTEEGWTHEQSVARGMIDLRSINARGTVCAGCHIGNAKKEVDHELIASGHPILAFELDNYTESMPPHWTPNRESHGLRAWAVGQVVSFREYLDNLSRHARGNEWPEFSDMSCYNCHHDLKDSTWRQVRGWPDRAGLPSWTPQRWAVLRLILDRVSPGARSELDPLVSQLSLGVARMNNPSGVASAADRARAVVSPLVARVEATSWSDADVRALMSTITNDEAILADVHSAEQAALALQSLASVRTRRDARLLRGPLTKSIDALFEELKDRDNYEPSRFATRLNAVRANL
ncbi:MAG TPA: multiheme c-type cytochrome [Thermoanaerobaculia bacterium]|nr:multiheme c-type cytochrome [Thermoanaerobaculia bacterium]